MIYTSRFSGKTDLADFISGLGGWYDRDGNPVKFGQEGVSCYYSDELKDFEAFKEKTGGKIYQHYLIKVDEFNQNFVKEHCKEFDFNEVALQEGKRKKKYVYTYYGKEYTLKELNKHGVYIEVAINFNTLLDLIPYYPYLVSVAFCNEDSQHVIISSESYVDKAFEGHLQNGWISEIDYKKKLQNHYLEVCKNYFLYKLDERTKIIPITTLTKKIEEDSNYYLCVGESEIDCMHDIEFVWDDGKFHTHWTSPKLVGTNTIEISKQDIEYYLDDAIKNGSVKIKYIEKCEFPLEVK